MKNIQVIDDASNCAYSVFAVADADFALLFPGQGQDVEFAEDLPMRIDAALLDALAARMWSAPVDKKCVHGIHGTLFYGMAFKRAFYPTKREAEMLPG